MIGAARAFGTFQISVDILFMRGCTVGRIVCKYLSLLIVLRKDEKKWLPFE
jgi:hypothetical protein